MCGGGWGLCNHTNFSRIFRPFNTDAMARSRRCSAAKPRGSWGKRFERCEARLDLISYLSRVVLELKGAARPLRPMVASAAEEKRRLSWGAAQRLSGDSSQVPEQNPWYLQSQREGAPSSPPPPGSTGGQTKPPSSALPFNSRHPGRSKIVKGKAGA